MIDMEEINWKPASSRKSGESARSVWSQVTPSDKFETKIHRAEPEAMSYGTAPPGGYFHGRAAESPVRREQDGVTWERPLLDVVLCSGAQRSNILLQHADLKEVSYACVFINEGSHNANERYEMMAHGRGVRDSAAHAL